MSAAPIRFLFDFISPNAYLAWAGIHELAQRHGRDVEPVPVLFAGLLNAHGLVGPAESKAKWHWMLRDILRKADRLSIPLVPPHSHPFNPLLALRVAGLPLAPEVRDRLIAALFDAAWAQGEDLSDPAVVARVASGCGLDGTKAVANAAGDGAKRQLRRRTEQAADDGVFGVPTMCVDDQLFWGFDDFAPLERYLDKSEPALTPERLEPWSAVRPSARRREPS